jgi:glycosyltransferase involved in cell wall biosynthesis
VRVHLVDPSAYTPPYDDALARALADAGADVTLYTSHFSYSSVPTPQGYERRETFYRLGHSASLNRARSPWAQVLKLIEHVPDMLRYRRAADGADVVHFQWLTVQQLDVHLLPARRPGRPLILTAHDILPREPRSGQVDAQRRLYDHFDAIVVHSEYGRRRLTAELDIAPGRVHVIPHGVLTPAGSSSGLPAAADAVPARLPAAFDQSNGPVVLFFGLLRPYKGLDVLLDAWRQLGPQERNAAELWIAGMPRMDTAALVANAPPSVRFFCEYVDADELRWLLRRAELVVLPYREIDASGAAFTAIGAGVPLLLSEAGSFPEIAATGAARTVPVGDSAALAGALADLLGDPRGLEAMARRAAEAAAGPYAWGHVGTRTLALYDSLVSKNPAL